MKPLKLKIRDIRVRAVAAPMKKPLATSIHTVTEAALVLVDLQTDGGIVGRSYLFAVGRHNLKAIAALVEAMAAMVKGDEVAPFDLEKKLRAKYALLGVHNIVLFAIAGIDMAAWDAFAQALGQPLARVLGGGRGAIPRLQLQGSWAFALGKLPTRGEELVDEGFGAVKLRVGRRPRTTTSRRIRAVKQEIGPDVG